MAVVLAACSSSSSSGGSSSGSSLSGTVNGSGSTLQLVYQEAAISAFRSVESGITVNYGAGGSGKGRSDLAAGTVNYAGSDSPIPSAEASSFKGKTVLYFPDVISPVTVSYNLSGVTGLKLDAPVIADIFQAKITKWNDPAITALNPGVKLTSTAITIARRSAPAGSTKGRATSSDRAKASV
jgi:phosphate transport system substrate-binding protein